MRKLLLSLMMLLAFGVFAQNPLLPIDMEDPADDAWVGDGGCVFSLETTMFSPNQVGKIDGGGDQWNSRVDLALGTYIDMTTANKTFTFELYTVTEDVMTGLFQISSEKDGGFPIEMQFTTDGAIGWQTIELDFINAANGYPNAGLPVVYGQYARVSIFTNFGSTNPGTYYFDDIAGAANGEVIVADPAPTTVPPIPGHAEEDVISIYTEVYTNLVGTNFNPGWGQVTTVTVDYVAAGNNTLKYENLNYQGTQYTNQDVSGFEYIHVDFWTPNSTVLNFYLISSGPGEETAYALPIAAETWVSVDIPLLDYVPPVNLADVFQFKVDGNGTVYFDNFYFWKEPVVPGTDANLSDLQIDGTTVDGFAPGTLAYTVELPEGTTVVPTVFALTNDPEASFEIFDAAALPGTTEVEVTASNGTSQQTYTVEFTVAGPVPSSEYCATETWHFGNPAEEASAIFLTIMNIDANTMFVEIESAFGLPVDFLDVLGGSGATPSAEDFSVPGKISRTLTWTDPPADVDLNIQWSKEGFVGNWQLSPSDITVPFAATCSFEGPFDVTFKVDMSQYGVDFTNVFLSGSFNGWNEAFLMLDEDMDNIYETTLVLDDGTYEYKFQLDNWSVQEEFVGGEECTVTNGDFTNRFIEVSNDIQLPAVCWNSCDVCPEMLYDVNFSVDMNEHADDYDNVYLSGSFTDWWCGDCTEMLDPDTDGVYEVTVQLTEGAYEYKFTLDGWAQQENFVGGEECTVTNGGYTNRFVEVSENVVIPEVCWNFCVTCEEVPEPQNVTFKVDLSQYKGVFTNAYLNGSFNGWCGDCSQMLDPDMDDIYEITMLLDQGSYEYKFTLDGWSVQEEFTEGDPCTITLGGYTNRALLVEDEEVILDVVCWNSCDACPMYQTGWGGISANVMPEAKISMEELFAPVVDDMVILIGKDGIFWPGQNLNTIGDWDTYKGYKVKFSNGVDFIIEGAELTDRTVSFDPGVAYIPVLSLEPASVEDVLVPHGFAIEYVFDIVNQEIYWPTGGIVPGVNGALETLEPGYAYLASFNNSVILDFDVPLPKAGILQKTNFSNNTNWNSVVRTGSQHIISLAAANLETGDVVGVFAADGTCTGMAQYNGIDEMLPLVVYGNDITTTDKDGMAQNEFMSFKVFSNETEMEVSPVYNQAIANHDGLFAENGLSIISELKMGATGINATEAIAFSIFPNPNNGKFNISIANVDGCNISVMNIRGQQVYAAQVNGTTMLDLSGQAKGVYFVRLSNARSTSIEKIVIE